MLIKKKRNINVFKCVIYFFSCLDRIEILFIAKKTKNKKKHLVQLIRAGQSSVNGTEVFEN